MRLRASAWLRSMMLCAPARAAGAPDANGHAFPGAGHNLMRYRSDELSAALLELLEEAAHQRP